VILQELRFEGGTRKLDVARTIYAIRVGLRAWKRLIKRGVRELRNANEHGHLLALVDDQEKALPETCGR
jgi:hypothetical protein